MSAQVPEQSFLSRINPIGGRAGKALSAVNSFAATAFKKMWNVGKDAKPEGKWTSRFLRPFRAIGTVVGFGVYTAVSAVVTTVGAAVNGVIGGFFQTVGGAIRIANALAPWSWDSKFFSRLGNALKDFGEGLLKFVGGSVIVGAIGLAVASGVGAPAVGAISLAAPTVAAHLPLIGGLVGKGITAVAGIIPTTGLTGAATSAVNFITNTALPAITSNLGIGIGAATSTTGLAVGATLAAVGLGVGGKKLANKIRGTPTETKPSASKLEDSSPDSEMSDRVSELRREMGGLHRNSEPASGALLPTYDNPEATSERMLVAARGLSPKRAEKIDVDGINNTLEGQGITDVDFEMQNGKPVFSGRDPIEALAACGDETLTKLSYTLSLPESASKEQIQAHLDHALSKGINISGVEVDDKRIEVTYDRDNGYQFDPAALTVDATVDPTSLQVQVDPDSGPDHGAHL